MSSAAKVGAFMLLILGILGFFVLRIEDIHIGKGKMRDIKVRFDNVAGLDEGSAVRIAGVRKGTVKKIDVLPDGKAEVVLEVDDDVPLRENASARVANLGLLGEKYIEIDPGTPDQPLKQGETVTLAGSVPASIDDVTQQVAGIAQDIKAVTASMRTVMAGPEGEQRLVDIVENVRDITQQMRELVAANRSNVDATMANAREITAQLRVEIPRLADSLDRVAKQIGGTVGENREDVRVVVANLKGLSNDLRTTADNLNAITGQVKSGEGTMGKLFYSDEAHEKLTGALSSVESGVKSLQDTLGRANRIGLDVNIKTDYLAGLTQGDNENTNTVNGSARAALGVVLTPNPEKNRFFNVELADDPRGRRREKLTEETVTDVATGQSHTTITKQTKYDRDFVISAQAGWHLDDLAVRVGLFDSTGGVGADYRWNDRIRVTGEAFDFGGKRDDNPHLRVFGEYVVRHEKPNTPALFVRSGVDNALNDTAFIFGGGIRWKDDDLKYLLGSVPLGK
jgi:phospholipid/cholesterol/gamma-HCH transport system substrate-binding protein